MLRAVLLDLGADRPPRLLLVIHHLVVDGVSWRILLADLETAEPPDGPRVELPVTYNGPDLAEVAGLTGLTEAEVVRRHAGADYTVAFCGFAPGFGYLAGLPAELQVPRRATPRIAVAVVSYTVLNSPSDVTSRSGRWK